MVRWFRISPRNVSPLLLTTAAVAVIVTGLAGGRAEAFRFTFLENSSVHTAFANP